MDESLFRKELKSRKLGLRKLSEGSYQITTPWGNRHGFCGDLNGYTLFTLLPHCISTVDQEARDVFLAAETAGIPVVQHLD